MHYNHMSYHINLYYNHSKVSGVTPIIYPFRTIFIVIFKVSDEFTLLVNTLLVVFSLQGGGPGYYPISVTFTLYEEVREGVLFVA